MSDYLVDTNILPRWIQPGSSQCPVVRRALRRLVDNGDNLYIYITAQNQIEFWSVATRSAARGGLALAPEEADQKLQRMERIFTLLPDSPAILPTWRSDAGLWVDPYSHLQCFRFLALPGITIVDPASLQHAP